MGTLERAFAAKPRPDFDVAIANGGFPLSGMGSFPTPQQMPGQDFQPQEFQPFSPNYEFPPQSYSPQPFQYQGAQAQAFVPITVLADQFGYGPGSIHTIPTGQSGTVRSAAPSPDTSTGEEAPRTPTAQASRLSESTAAHTPTQAMTGVIGSDIPLTSTSRTATGPIINIHSPTTVNGQGPSHSRASKGTTTQHSAAIPSTPTPANVSAPPPQQEPAQVSSASQVSASPRPDSRQSRQSVPPQGPSTRAQTPAQVIVERDLPPLPESVSTYLRRTEVTQTPAAPMPASPRARSPTEPNKMIYAWSHSTPGPLLDSGARDSTILDTIKVHDNLSPARSDPRPWDVVTQRLHSMAAVWEEDNFVRAMKAISLGGELDLVPLTIYSMTIFKS